MVPDIYIYTLGIILGALFHSSLHYCSIGYRRIGGPTGDRLYLLGWQEKDLMVGDDRLYPL